MKKKSSFLSCFNSFKGGDSSDDPPQLEKAYKSDDDKLLPVVADRHVDTKADEFISNFHKKNQDIDDRDGKSEDVNQG